MVGDIVPACPIALDMFDPIQNRKERKNLMKVIDSINHQYGVKTIKLGVEGEEKQPWKVKCEHRSPNYLTNINEILTIKI